MPSKSKRARAAELADTSRAEVSSTGKSSKYAASIRPHSTPSRQTSLDTRLKAITAAAAPKGSMCPTKPYVAPSFGDFTVITWRFRSSGLMANCL